MKGKNQQARNQAAAVNSKVSPRPVIWNTDFWTDADDVMTARVLCWVERQGMVDIVAVISDTTSGIIVPALDAFLSAKGRPGITIGYDPAATDYSGLPPYQANMLPYPHSFTGPASYENSTSVYRRALVAATSPVDIITTGYQNTLSNLLQSTADSINPLTGLRLVAQKVNRLWAMGGQYPTGTENNFSRNLRASTAANYVCANWPTPITFLGYEVGNPVTSGDTLATFASLHRGITSTC